MISSQGRPSLPMIAFTLVLSVFAGTQAWARTPDGQTPANEGVCDSLQGGTPGLYGLCVAYCEAQDFDTANVKTPSKRILQNYRKKMRDGDPDMPCLQTPCPCWSADEMALLTPNSCVVDEDVAQAVHLDIEADSLTSAGAIVTPGRERCQYTDSDSATIRVFSISAEEAAACYQSAKESCDTYGLGSQN